MAERIERIWDGKTFVFVNCCEYDSTDVARVNAETDYTVVQLDKSTTDFWQQDPNPDLVIRSDYLFIWSAKYLQPLSDFADAVMGIFSALEDPDDFIEYSYLRRRRSNARP